MKKLLFLAAFVVMAITASAQNPKFSKKDPFNVTTSGRSATFTGTIQGLGHRDRIVSITIKPSFSVTGTCDKVHGVSNNNPFDCGYGEGQNIAIAPFEADIPAFNGQAKLSQTIDFSAYFNLPPTQCGECPSNDKAWIDNRVLTYHGELTVVLVNGKVVTTTF